MILMSSFLQRSVWILFLVLSCTLAPSMSVAAAKEPNCMRAKGELTQLLNINPQSPKVKTLMKRVSQCIDEVAAGRSIPVEDVELMVHDLIFIKNSGNDHPMLVATGSMSRCSQYNSFNLKHVKSNFQYLYLYGQNYSCGYPKSDLVTYQREINIESLAKGTHTIRYYPWGSSESYYKELTITID